MSRSRRELHSTTLHAGRGPRLETLREIAYPDSLGFLWETVSEFLGMDRYAGPAKLMGLAAFGRPTGSPPSWPGC